MNAALYNIRCGYIHQLNQVDNDGAVKTMKLLTYRFKPSISNEMHKWPWHTKQSRIRTMWCSWGSNFWFNWTKVEDSLASRNKQATPVQLYWIESGFIYHCQNRNFNKCLPMVGRLIFYDLNCNKTISFWNPAFCNLSKSPLAKNVFHNVPKT